MNKLPEWQAFTGQSDEAVLGFGWADAIHPDDRPRVVEEWNRCIATGSPYKVEERVCSAMTTFTGTCWCTLCRCAMRRDRSSNGWVRTPMSPNRSRPKTNCSGLTSVCKNVLGQHHRRTMCSRPRLALHLLQRKRRADGRPAIGGYCRETTGRALHREQDKCLRAGLSAGGRDRRDGAL